MNANATMVLVQVKIKACNNVVKQEIRDAKVGRYRNSLVWFSEMSIFPFTFLSLSFHYHPLQSELVSIWKRRSQDEK